MEEYITTREAARFLGISVTAMLRKKDLLGARGGGPEGYYWPVSKLGQYKESAEGKALTDPTRGGSLKEEKKGE